MAKLFVFGCSYTQDFNTNRIENYIQYYKFRGGNYPETWSEVLGRLLNYEVVNYGVGGSGNEQIFQQFCDKCSEIKQGDMVIIEWSYVNRYRFADSLANDWTQLGPGPDIHAVGRVLSQITHDEICVNRSHKVYRDLIYSYEKIIDRLSEVVGFDHYYWSADGKLIYTLPHKVKAQRKYLLGSKIMGEQTPFNLVFNLKGERIFEETKGEVVDYHFGESAHRIMGELFYEYITKLI